MRGGVKITPLSKILVEHAMTPLLYMVIKDEYIDEVMITSSFNP